MSGGREAVSARVWLLDAPDSLSVQSHHNPDGTGLGTFAGDGRPIVHKAPISAFSDADFAAEARAERSRTFLAHVRFASTGARTVENTHPFEQDDRLFAHNGVLTGLAQIEARLGDDTDLLHGQTDSERLFALITHETRRRDGDLRAGILAAVGWIAAEVPIYSLNFVIATAGELFVLRYPDTNTLYLLEREATGEPLHHHSSFGTCVRCDDAASSPVVVFASEPMDDDPGWRPLDSGELVHVGPELRVSSAIAFPDPPAQLIDLKQLDEHGRASQGEATKRGAASAS
jgi:predicted glutamine amidotransferase